MCVCYHDSVCKMNMKMNETNETKSGEIDATKLWKCEWCSESISIAVNESLTMSTKSTTTATTAWLGTFEIGI